MRLLSPRAHRARGADRSAERRDDAPAVARGPRDIAAPHRFRSGRRRCRGGFAPRGRPPRRSRLGGGRRRRPAGELHPPVLLRIPARDRPAGGGCAGEDWVTPASLPPDAARATIDQLIGSGDVTAARAALGELWQRDRRTATAGFVVSRFERIAGELDLAPLRLAIERSFTVEPFVPVLRAEAFSYGIDVTVHVGAFGTYVQDVLDETSPLYEFAPDAVLLAVDARDVAPNFWYEFDPDPAVVQQRVGRVAGDFGALVDTLRRRSSAQVVIQGLELPAVPPGGILDAQLQVGQQEAFRQVNRALGDLARRHPNVYVLDYDGLVRRHGALTWHDPHRWSTARLPVAAAHVVTVGREWARFVPPLAGRVCKVLAVDLDNTLWGGVLGEDG